MPILVQSRQRDRSFSVVFGHKTTHEQHYRINLVKEEQGEGKKPKVFLKSVERASTRLDKQLKFTIQKPKDPLIDATRWEQLILHGTQEQEMEKLIERTNGSYKPIQNVRRRKC